MIELVAIKDHGNIARERIVFRATESKDIGGCIVLRVVTVLRDKKRLLQNTVRDAYWFIDRVVTQGDLIILYTKATSTAYKIKAEEGKKASHFFYWGLTDAIWGNDDSGLAYGTLSTWSASVVDHSDEDLEP